jgi:hypothetical protein
VAISTSTPRSISLSCSLEADAADKQRLGQLRVLGIFVEVLGHLGGEFARRAQHQLRGIRARARPRRQKRDHRQREAGGLAGAGLGDAQHVLAFQRGGDRAGLDRSGGFVASFGNGLEDQRVQLQVGKFRHERPSGCGVGPQG